MVEVETEVEAVVKVETEVDVEVAEKRGLESWGQTRV